VSNASVDTIKQLAGGMPGKKIGIRFQGYGSPGRRRSRGWIPELEMTQDFFNDGRVFDEADDDFRIAFRDRDWVRFLPDPFSLPFHVRIMHLSECRSRS
jgi:hypothetical protein